jgi:hypothetical protein
MRMRAQIRQRRRIHACLTVVMIVMLGATIAHAEEAAPEAEPAAEAPAAAGVDEHVQALRSPDVSQRTAAARALGEARSVEAVQPLIRALREDPSPEVRGWTLRSLDAIGTNEANAAIASAARSDADERVRGLASQLSGVPAGSPFGGVSTTPAQQQAQLLQPGQLGQPMYRPQRRRRPGLGLMITGWSVFGGTYLISLMAAAATTAEGSDDAWPLFIPAIGPVIGASRFFQNDWDTPLAILCLFNAVVQLTGLSLLIIGHLRRRRARNSDDPNPRLISVVPTGPAGSAGLSIGGLF